MISPPPQRFYLVEPDDDLWGKGTTEQAEVGLFGQIIQKVRKSTFALNIL
jgi:hypothetical protein